MNKQFMLIGDKVIVSTETGMNEPISYRDNIEDILLFENEIEYLKRCLEEDEKFLADKTKEKDYRRKSALKNTAIVSGSALAASGLCYLVSNTMPELANQQTFDQLMVIIGGVGVMFGPFLGWMEIVYGPSKNLISCYEERISYEKEMLDILNAELELLKSNVTTNNRNNYEEMIPYSVRDEGAIKYLKDSIRLRDIYGTNKSKIMKMYYNDELSFWLKESHFDDNAIMDFMTFLDSKCREDKEVSYSINSLKK